MSDENLTNSLQEQEGEDDSIFQDSPAPKSEPQRRKAGRPKGSGVKYDGRANLIPFTSETAKAISAKANAAKKARAELRRRMLAAAVEAGIESQFMKALKEGNETLMTVVEKASRMTGIDFASSEEAVQNVNVKADTTANVKADHSINITFTDAPSPTK